MQPYAQDVSYWVGPQHALFSVLSSIHVFIYLFWQQGDLGLPGPAGNDGVQVTNVEVLSHALE